MFFSSPIQWYHSHADPIWPDGTFNNSWERRVPKEYQHEEKNSARPDHTFFQLNHFGNIIPHPSKPSPFRKRATFCSPVP